MDPNLLVIIIVLMVIICIATISVICTLSDKDTYKKIIKTHLANSGIEAINIRCVDSSYVNGRLYLSYTYDILERTSNEDVNRIKTYNVKNKSVLLG